jgi:hypothetical protein
MNGDFQRCNVVPGSLDRQRFRHRWKAQGSIKTTFVVRSSISTVVERYHLSERNTTIFVVVVGSEFLSDGRHIRNRADTGPQQCWNAHKTDAWVKEPHLQTQLRWCEVERPPSALNDMKIGLHWFDSKVFRNWLTP